MSTLVRSCWIGAILFAALFQATPRALASTISVGIGAFGSGSTLTTFTGLADGTEVNGLAIDGIQFSYSLGNGNLIIDGGPGTTNNITPPNIVSVGAPQGILILNLPSFADTFGYGYALQNFSPIANATTIALFSGPTAVGTMSYNSVPNPAFSGGFAGIQSTVPFNRVQLTFNSAVAPSFAVDNIRTFSSVPEPTSLVFLATGLASIVILLLSQRGLRIVCRRGL